MKACLGLLLLLGACIDSTQRPVDTSADTGAPDGDSDAADAAGEPCDAAGTTRCSADALATEVCIDGTWRRAPCADDRICVTVGGAQCIETSGEASCRDTLYCFLGCELVHGGDAEARDTCSFVCAIEATRDAQREVELFTSCTELAGCNDENAPDGLACIASACSQTLAVCYFDTTGAASCADTLRCRAACSDPTCEMECGADATPKAQGEYAVLDLCTRFACTAASDLEACVREVTGPLGTCGRYATTCLGPR